jgi:prolyl oligopeptidase PreP (S9A serine peptidase family)
MGVEFTQHPEMWNAVVIQVPLLGHGAGANLKEQAKTWAEQYTYLTRKLMD